MTMENNGPNPAEIELLESFREYLLMLAKLHLDPRLQGKLDAADIVQQTMVRAYAAWGGLRDKIPEVVRAWLRTILASVLADAVKYYHRDCRDVNLERNFAADLDQSNSALEGWLQSDQTSPSMGAARNEELLRLSQALMKLRDDMREVIVLKYLKGFTLEQIAEHTKRTTAAAAGLLRRGLEELRKQM